MVKEPCGFAASTGGSWFRGWRPDPSSVALWWDGDAFREKSSTHPEGAGVCGLALTTRG